MSKSSSSNSERTVNRHFLTPLTGDISGRWDKTSTGTWQYAKAWKDGWPTFIVEANPTAVVGAHLVTNVQWDSSGAQAQAVFNFDLARLWNKAPGRWRDEFFTQPPSTELEFESYPVELTWGAPDGGDGVGLDPGLLVEDENGVTLGVLVDKIRHDIAQTEKNLEDISWTFRPHAIPVLALFPTKVCDPAKRPRGGAEKEAELARSKQQRLQ